MSSAEKRLRGVANNPNDVRFDELCAAAEACGFMKVRQTGSHHHYRHPEHHDAMLTLQPRPDGKAKPFQVKQFLFVVDKYFPELLP